MAGNLWIAPFWLSALSASIALATSNFAQPVAEPKLFQAANACIACHNGLVTQAGEDVSFGGDWSASMMANSARDPYWQASVRREVLDRPESQEEIEDTCATCHMPMSRSESNAAGQRGAVFAHLAGSDSPALDALAMDGVSCTLCHQIENRGLGTRESFDGRFVIDAGRAWGERRIYGPYELDAGRTTVMRSATRMTPTRADHISSSELCATCHTLYTKALDARGRVIGELPEQMPFLEWRNSDYAGRQSCQSCHMPVVIDSIAITGVLGQPRAGVARHTFRGGNFFMLRMLNRFRNELGVEATPSALHNAAENTVRDLQTSAARLAIENIDVTNGRLVADVIVTNLAGHKLPTAYPSRRVWIHFVVRDGAGRIVFESGAMKSDGAIAGNDNDEDGARFEPHYTVIERADQVQVYESVMVDSGDRVTTGLLSAVRFVKDNRVLPEGFARTTENPDIAVRGDARDDTDFTGGSDRTRFSAPVNGTAYRVEARLLYQPIGFRWANNLGGHRSAETDRFVGYFRAMAHGSATVLATASADTR